MSSLSENRQLLESFVSGQLDEQAMASLLERLADDDEALQVVDELWANRPVNQLKFTNPTLDSEVADRVESRLFNSLHRSDLGGKAVRMGTESLLSVILAFLKPLFSVGKEQKPTRREN